MNTRILKIELAALFTLTLISLLSFYFGEGLGDNAFVVTSDTQTVGFFGYYLSSLVQYIGYFSGPWLLASFGILMISYVALISHRECWQDSLLIIPVLVLPLSFCHLFFPQTLGEGLRLLLAQNVGLLITFLVFVASLAALGAGLFRSNFIQTMKKLGHALWNGPIKVKQLKEKRAVVDLTERYRKKSRFSLPVFTHLRLRAPLWMKGESRKKVQPVIEEKKNDLFAAVLAEKSLPVKDDSLRVESIEDNDSYENYSETQVDNELEDLKVSHPSTYSDEEEDTPSNELKDEKTKGEKSYIEMQIGRKLELGQQNIEKEYSEIVSCMKVSNTNSKVHIPDHYFGEIIQILEGKLAEFDIVGRIVNIMKGPVVDTFELELGPGIMVTKVSNRSDDLSLALKGVPVRIVYPMEGKTTIGIEVPRDPREIIYLDQIITDQSFEDDRKALPIVMGLDAFGEVYITDLTDMPHMLVAGATKSGKSVFINTMLISLLVKKTPRDLRLILIDPKHVELSIYKDLPHLAMPVITDPKLAAISLLWAVEEMERRYSILTNFKVRNIESFHRKLEGASVEQIADIHQFYENQLEEDGYRLPYIVIIIDEFADLILTKAGKEIELYVNRLAAKARAAGIHLVVATQRPSVKVITGNIKSNFPSRVAFQVMSGIDSRTILDSQGAEKLLGKGDMLFSSGVMVKRAHSAYVSDAQVGEFVKNLNKLRSSFLPTAMDFLENGGEEPEEDSGFDGIGNGVSGKLDDRYEEALEVARSKGVVSASMLQRNMGIGYPKAAKIVDQMEKNGVIGPARGSKPREVIG